MIYFLAGLALIFLVIIHELGHYLVAKRNGVEAEEFGVGFPPKLFGKTMGKGIWRTHYSFNLLPFGGFVRLKGENDADKSKGSFGAASLWVKTKISLAGVAVNWLAAIVLLTILAWTGMPQVLENQFTIESDTKISSETVFAGFVEADSPAQKAGLEIGDKITVFAGEPVDNQEELFSLTEANAGKEITVEYTRDGETFTASTTLNESNEEQGYFGVGPTQFTLRTSTWSAPIVGVGLTAQLSWETLKGLGGLIGDLFSGNAEQAGEQVAGPVGIFRLFGEVSQIGPQFVLFVIAIISLTLAVMNVLPIPALDGGSLYIRLFFRAINKPLTEGKERAIMGTGMVFLLGLIVLVTIIDISRIVR